MTNREYGPAIGSHLGKPIYESITDHEGKFVFDRVAQCDPEGCSLHQLKRGEILLSPGLIYKQVA